MTGVCAENPPPTNERIDGTTSTPTTVAPTKRDRTRRTVASKTQDTDSFPPQPQANTLLVIITATAGQRIARLRARVQTLQQELQLLKSQGHDVIPQRTVHGDTLATSQRATPGSTAQAGGGKGACMCAWRPMAASVFAWSDRDVMCLGVVRASPEGEEAAAAAAAAAAPPPLTAVDDDDVVSTALSQVPEHTHTSQMQEGCRPSLLWWLWWATSVPRFHDAHTAQPAAQRQWRASNRASGDHGAQRSGSVRTSAPRTCASPWGPAQTTRWPATQAVATTAPTRARWLPWCRHRPRTISCALWGPTRTSPGPGRRGGHTSTLHTTTDV